MVASNHGRPSPRKTFTQFDPVTFPIAASANSEELAAVTEAKVSGREVPKATKVIAVTDYFSPAMHPNMFANSATTAVTIPIIARDTTNAAHPFQ